MVAFFMTKSKSMLSPMSPILVDQHALSPVPSGIYKRYIARAISELRAGKRSSSDTGAKVVNSPGISTLLGKQSSYRHSTSWSSLDSIWYVVIKEENGISMASEKVSAAKSAQGKGLSVKPFYWCSKHKS